MEAALQQLVRARARFRCEYCRLPEALASTPFQFDHIIARFHEGGTAADNLAFACFHCNSFKGTNVAGVDPDNGDVIRLFHPRRDTWSGHFVCEGERLLALTPVARVTIRTLRLNHPHHLALRRLLLLEGVSFA